MQAMFLWPPKRGSTFYRVSMISMKGQKFSTIQKKLAPVKIVEAEHSCFLSNDATINL